MLNLLLEVSEPMTGSGANNRDVKKINRIRTIRSIFSCDRISQPELAAKVNNSWPTVLQNVKELMAMGLVQEVGTFESTGGRKARAFAPVRNARLAVGLEITQNHVGAVLVDLSGNLLHYERKKRLYERSDTYAEMLAGIVQGLIEKRAARSKNLGRRHFAARYSGQRGADIGLLSCLGSAECSYRRIQPLHPVLLPVHQRRERCRTC